MEHIIDLIIENIIGIVCAGLFAYGAKILLKIFTSLKGVMNAEKVNCREKIRRFGEFYITTNQITVEEYDDLKEIYDAYHELGAPKPSGTATRTVSCNSMS